MRIQSYLRSIENASVCLQCSRQAIMILPALAPIAVPWDCVYRWGAMTVFVSLPMLVLVQAISSTEPSLAGEFMAW